MATGKKYCTPEDVFRRLQMDSSEITSDDVNSVIADASAFIDMQCNDYGVDPEDERRRMVCIDLVASWASTAGMPAGAQSVTESVGDVSTSVSMGSGGFASAHPFWLSRAQKDLLGIRGRFGTITMVPDVRIY